VRRLSILIDVECSPWSHKASATSFCAATSISKPIWEQIGARSERYVAVASESCKELCFLDILQEDKRASTSMLRTSLRPKCIASRRVVLLLKVLKRVSREDKTDCTSSRLRILLACKE
jgi:hypothetical protein